MRDNTMSVMLRNRIQKKNILFSLCSYHNQTAAKQFNFILHGYSNVNLTYDFDI